MADEAELHDNSASDCHMASPFFTKLPIEVRFMIYREMLKGSAIILRRNTSVNVVKNVDPELRDRGIWDSSLSLHRPLLTCRQFYEEALPVYWAETMVTNGDGNPFGFASVLDRVPQTARPYIKTLRGIRQPVFTFDFNHVLPLDDLLHQFPRLEICVMASSRRGLDSPMPADSPWSQVWLSKVTEMVDWRPIKNLMASHKIEIVQKRVYSLRSKGSMVSRFEKTCYFNYSTNKIYTVDNSSWIILDDDEYFERILKKNAAVADDQLQVSNIE